MSSRVGKALRCALGMMLAGCGSTGGERGAPDAGAKTFARLSVVVTVARDGAPNATLGATARLLRYKGVDVESAQVLAGTPEAMRDAAGRLGACALVDDDALLEDALATSPPDAVVQMLDAGDLLVHVAGQTVKVSPRYVPEIVPFVSGVVYEAESQSVESLADGTRDEAFVAAFGGQQVGRFVAPADVPVGPRIMSVSDAADVTVTWSLYGGASGPVSIVLGGDVGPALRCQVADSGEFTVPAEAMARVRDAARGGALSLAVERTRSTPFSAPGLDGAEVEITVRDVVTLR